MATKLDICNSSLAMVSTQFMTSENETTPQGNACNAILPSRVDNLMELAVWDWAIARARLETPSVTADADLYPDAVRMAGIVRPTRPGAGVEQMAQRLALLQQRLTISATRTV